MSLSYSQWIFFQHEALLHAKAIEYANSIGAIVNAKERQRTALQAWANSLPPDTIIIAKCEDGSEQQFSSKVGGVGKSQSQHRICLADDFVLIKDGVDITSVETMKPLGDYWKSLDVNNRWGGDFVHPRPDPYHFERFVQ